MTGKKNGRDIIEEVFANFTIYNNIAGKVDGIYHELLWIIEMN